MLSGTTEGLLSSLISRMSVGSPVTRWSSSFTKAVERLSKANAEKAGAQLAQLEEWLLPNHFDNVCHQAHLDLLALWSCALRLSTDRTLQQSHRELVSKHVMMILRFYIIKLTLLKSLGTCIDCINHATRRF